MGFPRVTREPVSGASFHPERVHPGSPGSKAMSLMGGNSQRPSSAVALDSLHSPFREEASEPVADHSQTLARGGPGIDSVPLPASTLRCPPVCPDSPDRDHSEREVAFVSSVLTQFPSASPSGEGFLDVRLLCPCTSDILAP